MGISKDVAFKRTSMGLNFGCRGSGFEHDDRILRMNRMGRFEWMLSGKATKVDFGHTDTPHPVNP